MLFSRSLFAQGEMDEYRRKSEFAGPQLTPASFQVPNALYYQPRFKSQWYRCLLNGRFLFKKYHLSGLLLLKQTDSNAVRAHFMNEAGLTFFDFRFVSDTVEIVKIIPKLNRRSVVRTLQRGLQLFLLKGLDTVRTIVAMPMEGSKVRVARRDDHDLWVPYDNWLAFYLIREGKLAAIRDGFRFTPMGGPAIKPKPSVEITWRRKDAHDALPDSVLFDYPKANFTVSLTKITVDDAE